MKRTIISLACVVITLPCLVSAGEQLRFSADLSSIRVSAVPGEIINRVFRLNTATDARKAHFEAIAEDWWPSEDGKQSFFREAGTLDRSCGPWVALNPVEAVVDPGGELEVRISAAVPQTAEPGGYWCVLTVNERPDPLRQEEGIAVNFLGSVSIGIFIYIEPVERAARISGVDIANNEALIRVENEGNAPIGVEGRIEFLPSNGGAPAAVSQIARRTVVLEPIRSALVVSELPAPDELPSGSYLVRVILDIGLDSYIGVQKVMNVDRGTAMAGVGL